MLPSPLPALMVVVAAAMTVASAAPLLPRTHARCQASAMPATSQMSRMVRQRMPLRRGLAAQASDAPDGTAQRRSVLKNMLSGMSAAMFLQSAGIARAEEPILAVLEAETNDMAVESNAVAAPTTTAQYGYLEDPILSYRYKYPTSVGERKLSLVTSRKPEKYSSAAPLSSNFRHRIVNQMLDYENVVVYAMYVCPSIGFLKRFPPSDWTSQQVADTVLLDRLNAKSIEEGRRYLEENVEGGAKYQDEDGTFYFQYEHLEPGRIARGSQSEGRHNLAVTAARPGQDGSLYLFSLNMGCPEPLWEELSSSFYEAANSFRIDPLNRVAPEYVPPDKDPWAIL